jgi:hypothetical protein
LSREWRPAGTFTQVLLIAGVLLLSALLVNAVPLVFGQVFDSIDLRQRDTRDAAWRLAVALVVVYALALLLGTAIGIRRRLGGRHPGSGHSASMG